MGFYFKIFESLKKYIEKVQSTKVQTLKKK